MSITGIIIRFLSLFLMAYVGYRLGIRVGKNREAGRYSVILSRLKWEAREKPNGEIYFINTIDGNIIYQ